MTLQEMRLDFILRRKGSVALPITGMIVYSLAAVLSLVVDARWHNLVLTLCFWSILPVGAVIMRMRGEKSGSPHENPLLDLSNKARWMALSTWSIHIPIWIYAPALFPISVGIGFPLHWVIFSWAVDHPVGFVHLATRILFVLSAWWLVPANRMGAVAAGIAAAYMISVIWLSRIGWERHFGHADLAGSDRDLASAATG